MQNNTMEIESPVLLQTQLSIMRKRLRQFYVYWLVKKTHDRNLETLRKNTAYIFIKKKNNFVNNIFKGVAIFNRLQNKQFLNQSSFESIVNGPIENYNLMKDLVIIEIGAF